MRLIDPDPVLFSSLFDSRRVTRTDSPAASRRQGLSGGRGERGGGWRSRGDTAGAVGGTGGQVPRYTFSFHLLAALSEIEKSRKKKKEEKGEKTARARFFEEETIRKIFDHYSPKIGQSFFVRSTWIPICDFAHAGKKGKRNMYEGYIVGVARASFLQLCIDKEIIRKGLIYEGRIEFGFARRNRLPGL